MAHDPMLKYQVIILAGMSCIEKLLAISHDSDHEVIMERPDTPFVFVNAFISTLIDALDDATNICVSSAGMAGAVRRATLLA